VTSNSWYSSVHPDSSFKWIIKVLRAAKNVCLRKQYRTLINNVTKSEAFANSGLHHVKTSLTPAISSLVKVIRRVDFISAPLRRLSANKFVKEKSYGQSSWRSRRATVLPRSEGRGSRLEVSLRRRMACATCRGFSELVIRIHRGRYPKTSSWVTMSIGLFLKQQMSAFSV